MCIKWHKVVGYGCAAPSLYYRRKGKPIKLKGKTVLLTRR